MRRLVCFLPVVALAFGPSLASAQLTVSVGSFGEHTSGGTTINFATQPIGLAECDIEMPLTFSGITATTTPQNYIDVWSSSSSAALCGDPTNRNTTTMTTCRHVALAGDVNGYPGGVTFTMRVTPRELFGGCVTEARAFFFFDTTSSGATGDTVSTFAMPLVQNIIMDSSPPSAPTIGGSVAGDTSVVVTWTNPSDIGTQGGIRVYFDPTGCGGVSTEAGGTDGGTTGGLVSGGVPPASLEVLDQHSMSITSATIPIASLGWPAGTYGQRGALAVSVLDNALNPSPLSNVVCAEHVNVSGFWNQYCADRGLTVEECSAHYGGCSVGLPSRRVDLGMISLLAAALGAVFVRRRAR